VRRVLLFGTSANPPTGMGGHAGIVAWAAARDDVDEVWVLPVYRHAFEEKRDMPSFEDRMAMAKIAFEPLARNVKVVDAEKQVADRIGSDRLIGTIDVVRRLITEHPDVEFGLLLGADTHRDLMAGKWKESDALRRLVRVVSVPRKGVDESLPGPLFDDVSSTECRATDDPEELARRVQPDVLEYIRAHRLYAFREDPPTDSIR
jgi:nicotinate (nicotinamide) nucleotide adenylyltransferase